MPCGAVPCSADEMEGVLTTVKGGDEVAALQRLEGSLRSLRTAFREVKELAQQAEEAAAKCQVGMVKLSKE